MNISKDKPQPEKAEVIVWGLAAGRGSTVDAAPGALAWRKYPSREAIPQQDWRIILAIQIGES